MKFYVTMFYWGAVFFRGIAFKINHTIKFLLFPRMRGNREHSLKNSLFYIFMRFVSVSGYEKLKSRYRIFVVFLNPSSL